MISQVLSAFSFFISPNSVTPVNSATSLNALTPYAPNAPTQNAFDFDGDGKADLARFQKSSGEWKVRNSSNNAITLTTLGNATSLIAPGKFDSDSITDYAVFNAGTWTIKRSSDSTTQTITGFGQAGDKPTIGDYDGDGLADLAVYRPGNATWYIKQSSTNTVVSTQFGAFGDIPVQGNYDGDNRTDIAVFRPTSGDWHVLKSSSGYAGFHWGISSDVPVPADFDGDGKTDFAVFRGTTGTWYAAKSSTNNVDYFAQAWGNYGDQPAPADFDGDGKADFTVWRPTTGVWHSVKSSDLTYTYKTLGIAGDIAVESAYIKQIGSTVSAYELSKARLLPINESGGTSLYSRNVGWGTGLAGLSGRGLSAGFGISYNSLIWTKQTNSNGSSLVFDADNSNVSPGFRFGFPVIEPSYFDDATGKFAFLMVSPNGSRTEFRQIGATNTYETADSSYTQLTFKGSNTPNNVENLNITVIGTDGTASKYSWNSGAYRCKEIKDANGNFITINHDETGLLRTVTDTLNRVITVNYEETNGQHYPTTITQNWQNGLHTYATLSYTNQIINTNFDPTFTVFGPPNGTNLKVLDKITFADNSFTKFDYNTYGQVKQINNHAADGHKLNHTATNLGNISSVQTDCPRFTETKNYVENFNNNAETTVTNSFQTNQTYTLPDGGTATGNLIEVAFTGDPHNRISKTFTGNSGWKEGLPIKTEDFVNNVQKRWTWTDYENSDTLVRNNPRVIESKVGDTENGNIRKTTLSYSTIYNLPSETKVFDNDQTTVLKRSVNYYNLDPVYTNRRIIGLPSKSEQYGLENGILKLTGKTTYAYDEGNFSDTSLEQNISPTSHDTTNFGANFIDGRGNVTSVTGWNTEFPDDTSQAQKSSVKYNTAGSPVASIDVMGRTIKTSYADNWNAGSLPATYAYPTKLTDPNGNFSQIKYRFDIGANVWAKSPTIDGNAADSGKETTREFDSIGRPTKETLVNTGAYSRYEYLTNQIQSKVYTTITDADNNSIINTVDEVLSESWSDGAGRTRMSRTELPNSVGGFSGSITEYDILGQVKRTTVPTELNANWEAAGDDAGHPNFLWTSQEFDWKGRVTKEINTDGTDKLITYNGCGCAGGQVTTIQGEQLAEGRRTQKVYQDILGRTFKSETLNWNGSVYSSNTTVFDGADRPTFSRQFEGAAILNNPHQTTTQTFDGFGRVKTQHKPEQDNGTTTVYNYNLDNSISSMVDARGAITNYTYNVGTGQVIDISYVSPNTNIPVTPTVYYAYNNLGMRTQMVDGLGNVNYVYNNLGQMTSETRKFNDSLLNAPQANNSFKLEYSYTLNGQLKSLKDPFGQQINYGFDKVGRLNNVFGSTAFAGISNYADAPSYNARGVLKGLHYGNGVEMNITAFNDKLQATNFEVKKGTTSIIKKNYEFYADSSLKYSQDVVNPIFDRSYKYDFASRVTEGKSGAEARGGTVTPGYESTQLPYRQSYNYNVYNQLTQRNNRHWGIEQWYYQDNNLNYTYQNNRITNINNFYDADGRVWHSGEDGSTATYDAKGEITRMLTHESSDIYRYNDGNGREAKRKIKRWIIDENEVGSWSPFEEKTYFIRSSVLGNETVSEVGPSGKKQKTYITAGGAKLATQTGHINYERVYFNHQDASGASIRATREDGSLHNDYSSDDSPAELDPLGGNMGISTPYIEIIQPQPDPENWNYLYNESPMYVNGQRVSYTIDGLSVSQSYFQMVIESGRIGGQFGLLYMAAQASAQVTVATRNGNWHRNYPNPNAIPANNQAGIIQGELVAYYSNNNWSGILALVGANGDDCKPGQPCPKPRPTPTPTTPENPPPGMSTRLSDCANTVNQFVSSTYDANVIGQSNQLQGWNLLAYAYAISKAVDDTHSYATTGFRTALTQFGQNGQVYQHVYSHAATTIIGDGRASPFWWLGYGIRGGEANETGNQLSDREMQFDIRQQNTGVSDGDGGTNNVRQESLTEEQNDIAGRSIGALINNFRSSGSKDYAKLRQDIAAILCDN